jgi:signal transduction histidine kinase
MSAQPAELWSFFLASAAVVTILVVAIGAAVIVAQRKMTGATRAFAARQLAASEEERSRVARELHDDVSQQIAVLSQRLEALQDRMRAQDTDERLVDSADSVGDGLRDLAGTVRRLAHQMHPSMLEHLGLGAALHTLAHDVAGETGLDLQVHLAEGTEELPGPLSLTLYRICQEALRNVQKHADATRSLVLLWRREQDIFLEVSDDGRGFHHDRSGSAAGLGLVSMRERIRLVGGDLDVLSEPGGGTIITARAPLGQARSP